MELKGCALPDWPIVPNDPGTESLNDWRTVAEAAINEIYEILNELIRRQEPEQEPAPGVYKMELSADDTAKDKPPKTERTEDIIAGQQREIDRLESEWGEYADILNRLFKRFWPHKHGDGMNECPICNASWTELLSKPAPIETSLRLFRDSTDAISRITKELAERG